MTNRLIKSFVSIILCFACTVQAAQYPGIPVVPDMPAEIPKEALWIGGAAVLASAVLISGELARMQCEKYLLSRDEAENPEVVFDRIAVNLNDFYFSRSRIERAAVRMSDQQFRDRIDRHNPYNRIYYGDQNEHGRAIVSYALSKRWHEGGWLPFAVFSQSLLEVLCENPFEDFKIGNYHSTLVRLIRQTSLANLHVRTYERFGLVKAESEAKSIDMIALFQTLPEEKRVEYLRDLLIMFGGDPERLQKSANDNVEEHFSSRGIIDALKIVELVRRLELHTRPVMREAFLGIFDEHGAAEGMLYKLIDHEEYPVEQLCAWFPANEREANQHYMTHFLNAYPFESKAKIRRQIASVFLKGPMTGAQSYELEKMLDPIAESGRRREARKEKSVRELCKHIHFDFNSEIPPAMRMVLDGTVNEADTRMLKDFFERYEFGFKEEKSSELEEHRAAMFNKLLSQNRSNIESLGDIIAFLAVNPHLFQSDHLRSDCFHRICALFESHDLNTIPIDLLCAHIISLKLNRYLDDKDPQPQPKRTIEYCFLELCEKLSQENLEELFRRVRSDKHYHEFLRNSRTALENYREDFPNPETDSFICQILQHEASMPAGSSQAVSSASAPMGPTRSCD